MAKYSSSSDSYVYLGTDVLIKKENIKDAAKLQIAETYAYAVASSALKNSPVKGDFDIKHLQPVNEKLVNR